MTKLVSPPFKSARTAAFQLKAMLTIDSRERGLIRLFSESSSQHKVETLPVGDVFCQYENGSAWVSERKRFDDFAASIKDGRWKEQSSRLFASGHRVIYIFEGDFRDSGMYDSLLGAWLNSVLRDASATA